MRGILDGHIVMERAIAERGRYPAINVLKSISRTMPRAADPAYLPVDHAGAPGDGDLCRHGGADPARRLSGRLQPEVDEAIRLHQPLEAFLGQGKEEATSLAEGYQRLEQILGGAETEN